MCLVLAKEINSLKKYIKFGSASATQFITMSCSIELLWSLKPECQYIIEMTFLAMNSKHLVQISYKIKVSFLVENESPLQLITCII